MFGIDDMALATIGSGVMSGGANLLGGMIGASGQSATNAMSLNAMREQMNWSAWQADINRQWQEKMSSTAYQRSMADMKAAGLNPILAYAQGGASTPGGNIGTSPGTPSFGNPGAPMGAGVSAAGQAAQRAADMKVALTQANKDASQVDLNKATTSYTDANKALTTQLEQKAKADTVTSGKQQQVYDEQVRNIQQDTLNKGIDAIIKSHDATTAYQRSRLAGAEADQGVKWGPGTWGNLGGTVEKGVGRVIDAFRGFDSTITNATGTGAPSAPHSSAITPNRRQGPPGGLQIDMTRPRVAQ